MNFLLIWVFPLVTVAKDCVKELFYVNGPTSITYTDRVYDKAAQGWVSEMGDLYVPLFVTKPPVMVYAHGGGFAGGEINCQEGCATMSRHIASQGFVVFSIAYRLEGSVTSGDGEYKVRAAVEDMRGALRWLMKNTTLNVDQDNMFLGGDSAGAIAAVWAAYIPDAQYEGLSGNYGVTTVGKIQGILSISGCLENRPPEGMLQTNTAKWKRPKLVAMTGQLGHEMPFVTVDRENLCRGAGNPDHCYIEVEDGGHVPIIPYSYPGYGVVNSVNIMQLDNPYLCNLTQQLHDAKAPATSRHLSPGDVFV